MPTNLHLKSNDALLLLHHCQKQVKTSHYVSQSLVVRDLKQMNSSGAPTTLIHSVHTSRSRGAPVYSRRRYFTVQHVKQTNSRILQTSRTLRAPTVPELSSMPYKAH